MVLVLRNPYNSHCICSPSGEKERTVYKKKFCEDTKHYKLIPVEKVNRYAEIQSYLNQSAVDLCCKRLIMGDTNVTVRHNGMYCNIADIPGDFNSCYKTFNDVEKAFNNLPKEVVGEATNLKSFLKVISSSEGLTALNDRMNKYISSFKNVTEGGVTDGE